MDPLALFQRYGLQVTREGLEAGRPVTTATEAPAVAPTSAEGTPPPAAGPPATGERREGPRQTTGLEHLSDEDLDALRDTGDPAQKEQAKAEHTRRLHTDPLTGFGNLAAWKKAKDAADADPDLAVLSLDSNNLKLTNDTLGHSKGDEMILRHGRAIEQASREVAGYARVFRYGGDEFAAIVPKDVAQRVINRAEELAGVEPIGETGKFTALSGAHGATFDEADLKLNPHKVARKAALEAQARAAKERSPNYAPSGRELIDTDTTAIQTEASHAGRPDTAERHPADVATREGAEPRDRDRERAAADEGPRPPTEAGPARGGDLGGIPAGVEAGRVVEPLRGLPELNETFERRPLADNQARLTPAVRRELTRIVDELETFPFTNDTWNDLAGEVGLRGNVAGGHMERVKGGGGAVVYHDILAWSPVNTVTVKGEKKPAKKARGSRADVGAAVLKVLASGDIHNNLAEGAVRVAEHRAIEDWSLLSSDITVLPHRDAAPIDMPDLTADAQRRIDEEAAAASDAAEPEGAVDTSFRPEEFQQGREAGARPTRLETGETQPRLPGDVGDVRETEVATPQLEAPFSLTSETVPPAVKQTTLFQALFAGEPAPVATLSGNELGEGLDDIKELRAAASRLLPSRTAARHQDGRSQRLRHHHLHQAGTRSPRIVQRRSRCVASGAGHHAGATARDL